MGRNAKTFEALEKGDKIQFDGRGATKNPHKVVTTEASGGLRTVEGPGGAEKMLMQNKHNPDYISIMSMGSFSKNPNTVKNLRVVE